MKNAENYEEDLASIRAIMERSAKFISLSGVSGIASGIYALVGASTAYYLIYYPYSPSGYNYLHTDVESIVPKLMGVAALVLALSLGTGFWLSWKKAKANGLSIWNSTSKRMLGSVFLPLMAGGIFILILLSHGYFELVISSCLVFYGLALVAGSHYTFQEIRYLGFMEIVLGLISATWPGYGLILWSIGFGILHIIYGALMYKRYER